MIKAKTANIISKEMSEKIVEGALSKDSLMSDIEKSIIEYAEMGCNYCICHLGGKFMVSWDKIVLEKATPIIKKLETEGYNVILSQSIYDATSTVYIRLYWGNSYKEYNHIIYDKSYGGEDGLLYYTVDVSGRLN